MLSASADEVIRAFYWRLALAACQTGAVAWLAGVRPSHVFAVFAP
jgi:hypothetical protein